MTPNPTYWGNPTYWDESKQSNALYPLPQWTGGTLLPQCMRKYFLVCYSKWDNSWKLPNVTGKMLHKWSLFTIIIMLLLLGFGSEHSFWTLNHKGSPSYPWSYMLKLEKSVQNEHCGGTLSLQFLHGPEGRIWSLVCWLAMVRRKDLGKLSSLQVPLSTEGCLIYNARCQRPVLFHWARTRFHFGEVEEGWTLILPPSLSTTWAPVFCLSLPGNSGHTMSKDKQAAEIEPVNMIYQYNSNPPNESPYLIPYCSRKSYPTPLPQLTHVGHWGCQTRLEWRW